MGHLLQHSQAKKKKSTKTLFSLAVFLKLIPSGYLSREPLWGTQRIRSLAGYISGSPTNCLPNY